MLQCSSSSPISIFQDRGAESGLALCIMEQSNNITQPCPPIALTESFCLTVTITENSGKGFTKQNNVCKWDWGKGKASERNITRPLPVFTFAILSNLSKLLSWPLRKKKHMLNVKKQQNMTDHLHFVHLAPWLKTLNCVFFPWRQTTRPAFN